MMSRVLQAKIWALAIFFGIIAILTYWSTLAPSITWANSGSDSGELVTAAYFLGVAHPTGYPLYVVLGWLFTHIPLGSVAYRVNLLSALSAACAVTLCCAVIWKTLRDGSFAGRASGSALGALLLAFSPLFWSQALIAEVYALHGLMILLVFWVQERVVSIAPVRYQLVTLLGAVVGVGAANHSTLLLLVPGVLVRLAQLGWGSPPRLVMQTLAFAGGLLVGGSLYLLLPLFAASAPPFASWGGVQTTDAWWAHVSGQAYRAAAFSLSLEVVLTRIPALARLLLEQFGWIGYALILVGWWRLVRQAKGLALSLGVGVLLFLVFALNYPVLNSQVYLLGAFVLFAIALGWGAATVVEESARWAGSRARNNWLALALIVAISVGSYLASKSKVDVSNDREAYNYAQRTLDALPKGALILTQDDAQTFSLWYLQYVEGYRPDVAIVDIRLLTVPWYQRNLALTYPELLVPCLHCYPLQEAPALVLANASERPAYATFSQMGLPTVQEGRLYRYEPERTGSGKPRPNGFGEG